MLRFLNQERAGFSGVNHVLIAIGLFLLLLLIPIQPFSGFLHRMTENPVIGVISFLIIVGAALVPDMDNLPKDGGSIAVYSLGFLGSILSSTMVTISSVVTSIFHGKKDVKPNTQHRFFWHTLFVPLLIFVLTIFLVPEGDKKVLDTLYPFDIDHFPFYVVVILFLIGICVYISSSTLIKKTQKIIPMRVKSSLAGLFLMVASMAICLGFSTQSDLKLFLYCFILGYTFHLVGDLFADGGIPALFPISGIWGKYFMRVKLLPVTVATGSTIESLLKIVFLVIDVILVYFVFFFNK